MIESKDIVNEVGYQFTPIPTNLFLCCDNNVRSLLFTMVQLSTYYKDANGWFFRTNEDLRAESNLSENIVRATLSVLYENKIIEVKTVGQSNGKHPNYFRVKVEAFENWEKLSIEDAMKNPMFKISTPNYNIKGWKPSYLNKIEDEKEIGYNGNSNEIPQVTYTKSSKIEYNIDNEDNSKNLENKIDSIDSTKDSENDGTNLAKNSLFEKYKKQEDYLMDKIYGVKNYSDFRMYRQELFALMKNAPSEKYREKSMRRFKGIKNGKYNYFKKKYENEPYNAAASEFYQETGYGWLGKDSLVEMNNERKENISDEDTSQKQIEEDMNDQLREVSERFGIQIPMFGDKPKRESKEFRIFTDDDDDLPF